MRSPRSACRRDRHRGQGVRRQKGHTELYRGAEYVVDFLPKVKIEVAIDSKMLDKVVEAITRPRAPARSVTAKIFVSEVEQVIRIRTGETGKEAL